MEWLVLIMLILIGFVLLIMEFLVFPGVNVAGIIGFLCIGVAIYMAYSNMGVWEGHFTLLGTAVGGIGITYYALRSKTWKRLQLNTQIDGTVEGIDHSIREGDTGLCLGRLAPMGKVKVGDYVVEGQSQSGYINENSEVVVIKVLKNKIIVKLKTE
ncbi:hypothetical protein [uncultured Sanguibacteroides sp.]|uniref:hypothetical protein n=1 Tax=uncultured Sanguibacteroides sp. TaxID=1635151 RepID=UPI0025E87AC0|nr:hypothetical protein [uncultured Sanguibacteroides sp.]